MRIIDLGRRKDSVINTIPNTFIGGVASVITTPEELATRFSVYLSSGFSASNIANFSIVGNDIECYIDANFRVINNAFRNGGSTVWTHGNIVTHFIHTGTHCKELLSQSFYNQTNLTVFEAESIVNIYGTSLYFTGVQNLNLPNCVFLADYALSYMTSLETLSLPICTTYGATLGHDFVLRDIKTACQITAHASMQTINAGAEEGDLAYARNSRNAIITYV